LIRVDKENKHHQFFDMEKPVRSVQEDIYGNFWVGTEGGGLILFDRKLGKIIARYTTDEGLCNNSVLKTLYDGKDNLWISTFNGIAKFNVVKHTVENYYQNDGLQSNQFNYNAALALRSGQFVFGGIKGFSIFYPYKIDPVTSTPGIWLTGLRVNNIPVEADNSYVTRKNNEEIQEIKIPYNKAVLSFDFTALEYSAPNKISYAYYLEGADRDWNYSKSIRTANYTNLKEGKYTFRVKNTNAEGTWNTKEIVLKIIVLPPWYRTWWAYALYLSAAVAIIYFYLLYKAKQTKLKYEVKIAHLNAEKEKEMNEKKLSFFTDISHEFRTPLTLIINPVKDILDKNNAHTITGEKDLGIVYRNARRLLSLVDQLLLFRKADSGADKLKPVNLNFCDLCKEVYLCFIQQARSKRITYDFECENENLEIYADREKMEIILYNLVSNALKYTPAGGKVLFRVIEAATDVEIAIQDNGYGIPKEAGEKLFEKFYQAERKDSPSKPGFGIGLYLVKHFTEAHKGEISYKSEAGKGTTFTLKLKKGIKHLTEYTIFEDSPEEHAFLNELAGNETDTMENPDQQEDNDPLAAIVTEKKSILIVDDDAQIRQYIGNIFTDTFSLYEAANGELGIKMAQKYLPDIIISDVKMHGIGGIELCRFIKKDPALRHIPVILLTGSSSAQTKLEGVEGGADDYITKPFEKEMLVARVSNLLKTRNDLQQYFYNEITLNKTNLRISEEYKVFLEKCISIVETHLEDDDFTVKTLVAEIGMSHSNLFRKVKSVSGQSINVFIRFIRLRKAAELFINTNYNVNETAFQVGINDIKYFREQFNKVFGMNPSEYIKKYRKPFSNQYIVKKTPE